MNCPECDTNNVASWLNELGTFSVRCYECRKLYEVPAY